MNKATIVGYHGRRNIGDDLFLRIASDWLEKEWQISHIYVAGYGEHVPKSLKNLTLEGYEKPNFLIARFVWIQTFFYALRSRLLLFCAGSIFTIQPFFLVYITLKVLRILKPRMPVLALGVSIGPLRSSFDSYWCGKCLSLFDEIVLRDKESKIILEKINPEAKIKLAYDLALTLVDQEPVLKETKEKVIGICLNERTLNISSTENNKISVLDILVLAIDHQCKLTSSLRIELLVVCADEKDGDLEISLRLQEKLRAKGINATLQVYDGMDPEKYIASFSQYSAILTSRMHTGILAMMRGVPVLQIAYAKKIDDFYSHCKLGKNELVLPSQIDKATIVNFFSNSLAGLLVAQAAERSNKLSDCGNFVKRVMAEIVANN